MTRLTRLCRAMGVGVAVAAATLSMTQVAHADPAPPPIPPPTVPSAIAVDTKTNEVFLVGHVAVVNNVSTGVQIYKCQSGTDGTFSCKHSASVAPAAWRPIST